VKQVKPDAHRAHRVPQGGKYHCGLSVHGDIDIIPPDAVSDWELREKRHGIHDARARKFAPAKVEIVNGFQMRDPQMKHIGWALKAEMEADHRSGGPYPDSLGTAIATCLFHRYRSVARGTGVTRKGYPGTVCRRCCRPSNTTSAANCR
jgi:hypothetical protein